MSFCILIPARYHSTRLPGKPLLEINGKSIIKRVFEQASKCKLNCDIYVVTDSDLIITEIGINNCIKITEDCLNGTERICYALKKLNKNYNYIINIQGDEPFIDPNNINFLIDKFLETIDDEECVCSTLHYKLKKEDVSNINIGKLILDDNNNIIYCSRNQIPGNKYGIINDIDYLGHVGIFIFKKYYLEQYLDINNTFCMLQEDIEWLKIIEKGKKIKSYEIKNNIEIGVNTKEDYEYLINKYKN